MVFSAARLAMTPTGEAAGTRNTSSNVPASPARALRGGLLILSLSSSSCLSQHRQPERVDRLLADPRCFDLSRRG